MNAYVTLDSKKYSAPHGQWSPSTERPVVVRRLLSGNANVTFGPAPIQRWQGQFNAAVTPNSGYGDIADIRATVAKMQSLTFVDHYGTSHTVVVDRSVGEESLTPVWDSAENVFKISLVLLKI